MGDSASERQEQEHHQTTSTQQGPPSNASGSKKKKKKNKKRQGNQAAATTTEPVAADNTLPSQETEPNVANKDTAQEPEATANEGIPCAVKEVIAASAMDVHSIVTVSQATAGSKNEPKAGNATKPPAALPPPFVMTPEIQTAIASAIASACLNPQAIAASVAAKAARAPKETKASKPAAAKVPLPAFVMTDKVKAAIDAVARPPLDLQHVLTLAKSQALDTTLLHSSRSTTGHGQKEKAPPSSEQTQPAVLSTSDSALPGEAHAATSASPPPPALPPKVPMDDPLHVNLDDYNERNEQSRAIQEAVRTPIVQRPRPAVNPPIPSSEVPPHTPDRSTSPRYSNGSIDTGMPSTGLPRNRASSNGTPMEGVVIPNQTRPSPERNKDGEKMGCFIL